MAEIEFVATDTGIEALADGVKLEVADAWVEVLDAVDEVVRSGRAYNWLEAAVETPTTFDNLWEYRRALTPPPWVYRILFVGDHEATTVRQADGESIVVRTPVRG